MIHTLSIQDRPTTKISKSVTADNDYSGKYIVLDSDVNISNISWEPIGGNDCAFNGDFNGQNHSIIGMKIGSYSNSYMITGKNTYVGFFGILNKDAQIKNLKITGIVIESEGRKETESLEVSPEV